MRAAYTATNLAALVLYTRGFRAFWEMLSNCFLIVTKYCQADGHWGLKTTGPATNRIRTGRMDRRVLPRPKSDRIILPMRSSQTGRVDGSAPFGHRRSQHAFIDEASHLGEQMVLLDHIRG